MDDPKTTYSFNDLFEVDSVKNTEARSQRVVKDDNSYYKVKDKVKDLCFIDENANTNKELGSPVSAIIKPTTRGDSYLVMEFTTEKQHTIQDFYDRDKPKPLLKRMDCPTSEEPTTPAATEGGRKRKSRKYKRRSNKRKSRRNKTKKRKGRR